jgi:Ca-activated chloride channel family protein
VSPLAALAAALLAGAAPFVAEQPRVKEGNERLLSGDAAGALERFDAAEQEAGPRPEIDFDRGNALHALKKPEAAREAWRKALEGAPSGPLSSRALQNMGNALDEAGDQAGAARAFADALSRDPGNEDARYNLEVLLRRKAASQGKPKEPGDQGGKKPQDAQDQQPEPSQGQDQKRSQGDERQGKQGQAGAAGERKPGDQGERAGARPDGLGTQDAERLLDALRARERNMPLGPAGRKDGRKREASRDW